MKAPSLSVAVSQNPSLVFENNLRKEIELDRILSQDQKESRLKCKVPPILFHSIHFFYFVLSHKIKSVWLDGENGDPITQMG